MSLNIVPLAAAHLDEAAALVAARCGRLRTHAPELPERYASADTILPLLQYLHRARGAQRRHRQRRARSRPRLGAGGGIRALLG